MGRITNAIKALAGYPPEIMEGNARAFSFLKEFDFGTNKPKKNFSEGFNANTYVYSIINRLANSATSIPILVEKKNKKDEWEELLEGDFYNFVHNPNPNESYYDLQRKAYIYYLVTGNNFFSGVKGIGSPNFSEVHVLSPLHIEPNLKTSMYGLYADTWKYYIGNKEYPIKAEELKHVKMFNSDTTTIFGMSPLYAAYRTLVASNEIILADASLIKNRGAIGMLSNKGERPLSQPEREATDNALKTAIGGGENYGAIKTTSGNFDFISFAMSPTDLKILESGVMKLRDLCSVYGVSSKLFNDPNASTLNNITSDMKMFYLEGVLPPYEQLLESYERFIIDGWNKRDNAQYRIRINYDSIEALQENLTEKSVGQKNKSEIIREVVTGIGTTWSESSAVEQLMYILEIDESKAKILIDKNGVKREDSEAL
jgi:HK97 family phage portal protein